MTGSRRFARVEPAALKEREDGQGRVINMLIFYCNHCNEVFTGGDYESTDQIVERLDEHGAARNAWDQTPKILRYTAHVHH
jgi:hypothetical protein